MKIIFIGFENKVSKLIRVNNIVLFLWVFFLEKMSYKSND